jgi:hypothetical protein
MRPHEQLEVSDSEYTDLRRQGLIVDEGPPAKRGNHSTAGTGQNQEQ